MGALKFYDTGPFGQAISKYGNINTVEFIILRVWRVDKLVCLRWLLWFLLLHEFCSC